MIATAQSPGFEWVLLALGGVLTLAIAGFFLVVLLSKDVRKDDERGGKGDGR